MKNSWNVYYVHVYITELYQNIDNNNKNNNI